MNVKPFLTFGDSFAQNRLKSSIIADIASEGAKSRFLQFSVVKPFLWLFLGRVVMEVAKLTCSLSFKMVWSTNC